MNTKYLAKIAVIFTALSITGICFIIFGQQSNLEALQRTLPWIGTAIFASGLTFFMLEVVNTPRAAKA